MSSESSFRSTLTTLWVRLMCLGIVAFTFAEALFLAQGKAQGWTFYLRSYEVAFEVFVRLIAAALVGIFVGSLLTALTAPALWYLKASRERILDWVTKAAVVLVIFVDSRFALIILIKSWASNHGPRFTTALLTAHFLAFAVALSIPRIRSGVLTSLDGILSNKMTRRAAMATVAGTAALVVTEYVLSKSSTLVRAASPARSKPNLLLITFDALSAEDMSLYGYKLSTTPNINAFAQKATVFTNFYAGSTFTPPCIATMITGLYPSETHIYQMQGRVRGPKTASQVMRDADYSTGAFLSNSNAYYLAQSLENAYNLLPEPVYQPGALQHLWDITTPLHQHTGVGNRLDEYCDLILAWNTLTRLPFDLYVRYRAAASFDHAREMLSKLPDGFFLWVHVMTPHSPYLPDATDLGRFLPAYEQLAYKEEGGGSWKPHYPSNQQRLVDRCRLRYDEFVATADRAFGAFMLDMERNGKLQNTTVIVSADHGESSEGGIFQHETPYLTRPVIHIPLIVQTPGQQDRQTVPFAADQTSLAPTILELAGQPKPDWMSGPSLVPWLNRGGQGNGEGLAFTQYLQRNSVFRPLHHGTIGVVDGQYQYVYYLDTHKGVLRPLTEAQYWNLARSAENPERAAELRSALKKRFPDLVQ